MTCQADPTQRFGARAAAYARARPAYPGGAVRELARALRLPAGAAVVDLGCGTGLSSEAFLRAGFRVIGVEPNAAMRSHAIAALSGWPDFIAIPGRAESTGLADGCADLVIAAQAFHWFDVAATRAEALRILRAPARAALIWNDRRTEGSEFSCAYEDLLLRFSTEYLEVRHRHMRADRVGQFFGAKGWRSITTTHSDALDLQMLADRLNSASYVPSPDDPRHGPMMDGLRALFRATARDGAVTMEFETRVLFGEIEAAPRAPGPTLPGPAG